MRRSRDLTPSTGAPSRAVAPRVTKAGAWFDARQRGQRLPEHFLPEDIEAELYTQRMETQP